MQTQPHNLCVQSCERRTQINTIIQQFQGLKHVSGITSRKHKDMIASMLDRTGQAVTDRQGIADIFATFYEQLYAKRTPPNTPPNHEEGNHDDNNHETSETTTTPTNNSNNNTDNNCNSNDTSNTSVPKFTPTELEDAINQLKNGKCRDTAGVVAEMIKHGGQLLQTTLLPLYNDATRPNAQPPSQWRQTVITILHKSGDTKQPQNYRPIAIIPLLYKLFARLLYNRLEPLLDQHQCPDQAGFRHNYSTEDHLYTTTLLVERSYEWQLNLWVATIDFRKAFDTIDHNQLWQTLQNQNIPPPYIQLLQNLYTDQTATIRTDKQSRQFNLQRGVKQGDPLSSLLFNACLEDLFQQLKQQWSQKSYGIQLGTTNNTRLTNLRFADDILLLAPTLPQLTKQLCDLQQAAARYGLEIHPDKTKILSNVTKRRGRDARTNADINGSTVQILPYNDNTKYLGRKLTCNDYHITELNNRVASAWRKFHTLRHELTSKTYKLQSRLQLFDATVTPTMMYASGAWTLNKQMLTTLKRTQRKMLRLIVSTPRRRQEPTTTNSEPSTDDVASNNSNTTDLAQLLNLTDDDLLEPWPDYIKRATQEAETHYKSTNLQEWTTLYHKKQWRWAQRVANQTHNRWSHLAAQWQPELDNKRPTIRRNARPRKRWDDDITSFLQARHHNTTNNNDTPPRPPPPHWLDAARDTTTWEKMEADYIHHMVTKMCANHTTTNSNQNNEDDDDTHNN